VDFSFQLMLESDPRGKGRYNKKSIGFHIFDLNGERAKNPYHKKILENHRGYHYMRSVSLLDCKLTPNKKGYTIVPSTLL